jgi:hypothetical protein
MPKYDYKDRMLSMWLCGTFTRVGPVYGRQKDPAFVAAAAV